LLAETILISHFINYGAANNGIIKVEYLYGVQYLFLNTYLCSPLINFRNHYVGIERESIYYLKTKTGK